MTPIRRFTPPVPAGRCGACEVVKDRPLAIERFRASVQGMPLEDRDYTRLIVKGNVMMTDARFERITNAEVVSESRGNALVAGLGIGLILGPMLERCTSVTVIEKESDVISLVAPSYTMASVIHADIFEWLPLKGTTYDVIYFDIWPNICRDDIKESTALPEWRSTSTTPPIFEYREGDKVLGRFRADDHYEFYVDMDGHRLSKRFDEAKAAIERRVGVDVEVKGQQRLSL